MFEGVWLGRNLTLRMSKARFMSVIYTIVLISGAVLIYRYFS